MPQDITDFVTTLRDIARAAAIVLETFVREQRAASARCTAAAASTSPLHLPDASAEACTRCTRSAGIIAHGTTRLCAACSRTVTREVTLDWQRHALHMLAESVTGHLATIADYARVTLESDDPGPLLPPGPCDHTDSFADAPDAERAS
jgi:hypothetical protein